MEGAVNPPKEAPTAEPARVDQPQAALNEGDGG
jgi:hypothetical protein